MASSATQPDTIRASLEYFIPPTDGSKPWQSVNTEPGTGVRPRNFTTQPYEVEIENIRGKEDTVILDTAGFQFAKTEAKHKSFENDEEVSKEYYPESAELLKNLTGASRVVIFDHTIRRRLPGVVEDSPDKRQPLPAVHGDQTRPSAIARVYRHLPLSETSSSLSRRFQIINLWRPIAHPALDHPLALCDYRSVDPKNDLVPTILKYPDPRRDGETYCVRYNPNHKWKYVRGMTPEEVVLIFDSVDDGSIAVMTPHTAFDDPTTPPDAPLRRSIELRALVFYD